MSNAILGLDFGNARALATSSEPDAISSWLEKTCHGDLMEHFASIVREKIKDVTYYWKKLKRYWNKADKLALDAVPDFDDVASVSKSTGVLFDSRAARRSRRTRAPDAAIGDASGTPSEGRGGA